MPPYTTIFCPFFSPKNGWTVTPSLYFLTLLPPIPHESIHSPLTVLFAQFSAFVPDRQELWAACKLTSLGLFQDQADGGGAVDAGMEAAQWAAAAWAKREEMCLALSSL